MEDRYKLENLLGDAQKVDRLRLSMANRSRSKAMDD